MLLYPAVATALAAAWIDHWWRVLAALTGARLQQHEAEPLREARAILPVPEGSGPDQLRRAYRALARRYHPDAGGSEEMMKRLNRAYAALRHRGAPPGRPSPGRRPG